MNSRGESLFKPEQERISTLLIDTVTMLCKNGIQYNADIKIQGIIGITVDGDRTILVQIDKHFDSMGDCMLPPDTQIYASSTSGFIGKSSNIKTEDNQIYESADGFGDYEEEEAMNDNDSFVRQQPQSQQQQAFDYHEGLAVISSSKRLNSQPNVNLKHEMSDSYSGDVGYNQWNTAPSQSAVCKMPVSCPPRMRGSGGAVRGRPRGSSSMRGRGRGLQLTPTGPSLPRDIKPSKIQSQNTAGFEYGKIVETSYVCSLCGARYRNHCTLLTHQVQVHGREKKKKMGRPPKNPSAE